MARESLLPRCHLSSQNESYERHVEPWAEAADWWAGNVEDWGQPLVLVPKDGFGCSWFWKISVWEPPSPTITPAVWDTWCQPPCRSTDLLPETGTSSGSSTKTNACGGCRPLTAPRTEIAPRQARWKLSTAWSALSHISLSKAVSTLGGPGRPRASAQASRWSRSCILREIFSFFDAGPAGNASTQPKRAFPGCSLHLVPRLRQSRPPEEQAARSLATLYRRDLRLRSACHFKKRGLAHPVIPSLRDLGLLLFLPSLFFALSFGCAVLVRPENRSRC